MNGWAEKWRFQDPPWEFVWLQADSGPMKEGDRVKFVRRVGDGMSALVEHPEHGQRTFGSGSLDLPREFKTARGRWVPESDPRVKTFLLKALADVRSGGLKVQASRDAMLRRKTEGELLRILERNGWQSD